MKFIRDIIAEKRNASPAAEIPSEIEEVIYPSDQSGDTVEGDHEISESDSFVETDLDEATVEETNQTENTSEEPQTPEVDVPLDAQISGLLAALNTSENDQEHAEEPSHDAEIPTPERDHADVALNEQPIMGEENDHTKADEREHLGLSGSDAALIIPDDDASEVGKTSFSEHSAAPLEETEEKIAGSGGISPVGMLKRSTPPASEATEPINNLPRPRPVAVTRSMTRLHNAAEDEAPNGENLDEEKSEAAETPIAVPRPASARPGGRSGRVKTRILGFSGSEDQSTDPFSQHKRSAPTENAAFPVGWLIVIDGPGRGQAITLYDGVSQIGRGDTQAVRLNFGDNSISRENHAAIAFDGEQSEFFIGHGGKANLVRLNNQPVLSTQKIGSRDTIRIGETTLQFIALCGPDFSWRGK